MNADVPTWVKLAATSELGLENILMIMKRIKEKQLTDKNYDKHNFR